MPNMNVKTKKILASICKIITVIPKPVWAVGFALEQTLHVVALAVFSFLILKRLQHNAAIGFFVGVFFAICHIYCLFGLV
jgi:hypothetical protein